MANGDCKIINSANTTLDINDQSSYFLADINGIYELCTEPYEADIPHKTPPALFLVQNMTKRSIDLEIELRGTNPITALRELNAHFAVDVYGDGCCTLDYTTWENGVRRMIKGVLREKPQIIKSRREVVSVMIPLICQDPTFYDPTQKTATGNFNGANTVNISCSNSGDWPAYPEITYAGPVNHPKVTDAYGNVLEIENNVPTGGTLKIVIASQKFGITYTYGGTSVSWLGYRSGESQLVFVKPNAPSAHNLKFTATSGTGAITVKWYDRYSTHG